jgi:PAT family beta-lactamase induction signal transducer AmpG
VLAVLVFVSLYRMGDVLTLTLSHPLWNAAGYTLEQFYYPDVERIGRVMREMCGK